MPCELNAFDTTGPCGLTLYVGMKFKIRIFLCILYKLIKSKFELFTQATEARQNDCKIIIAISGLKDFAIRLNLIFTRIMCLANANNSNLQFAR